MLISRVDMKRYFEKGMFLFETARYKDAVSVFEKLIEIERSQKESYFTPFAEIYIEKSKRRMDEMLVMEERKWTRMKQAVVSEAERIVNKEAKDIARDKEREMRAIYEKGMQYYREGNYAQAIVELKKIKEWYPAESRLVPQAESFIEKAQKEIKRKQEEGILARMEAASHAKSYMEEKEKEKARLKEIFEQRLRAQKIRERIKRIEELLATIRTRVNEQRFSEAENVLDEAIAEFPENKRFKDILHYVEMQKLKMEEEALKRAREITEEKMLLDVARKHLIPEEKEGVLEKKKIMPLVKIPEIRKRLKVPISVDFKDVELDYVLDFLSDATDVNIVLSSEIDIEEKKVTIKIKDIPLEEGLRYILKSQDLVYRIEEDAVWVSTKEELANEKIDTRVYFLNQGVGRFSEFTGTFDEEGGSPASTEVSTVKDILENAVDWPKDSRLTMDERTGALIISNIPSNFEIIENLLYSLDVTPVQVLIEARFLELRITDVDEFGFEWKLNSDWGTKQNNAKQNLHGFASSSGVNFSDFSRSSEGFNLTYQGILSHPQFQVVMHALNEKQNVKTLSAPRITTLNNQAATIEVIDEYIYPTRYEVSLVQYDINGDGDFDDAGETEWANIPQDFVTRDVGILLHVKPSIGIDNKTITLALTPEVSEQDSTTSSYSYEGNVSIPNFKTRNLSTSVIIESGQTVVMGGLMSESSTNIKTKVPLLGDLPIVGGLFRKNTDNVERRNLLIFVTATVLDKEEDIIASAPDSREKSSR
jgi:type II secretory pathway component GspD/PulD (secretin)/outer membrane protein assembly factor BamD (BamD/ComL family)